MVGKAGEGITVGLMAKMIFQGSLLGDVDSNNFIMRGVAVLVESAASTETDL